MAKALKIVGTVVAVVALAATGIGMAANAGIIGTAATASSAATFAGVTAGTWLAAGAVAGVAGALISTAALAFKPKIQQQGNQTKFTTNPQSGIPYAIGRTRMSGLRIYAETWNAFKAGTEQDVLGFAVMLSGGGQIDVIEQFTADNETITFDSSTGASTTSNYTDWMAQKVWTGGTQSSALALTFGGVGFSGWTSAHKLSGITHALWALRFDKEGKHYGAGVPQPAWIGRWVRVYDPRLDSTYPGGSGACRALDESTYVWSRNPSLHALTWALGRWQNGKKVFGIGAPVANIRVSDFVEAANVADVNKWYCGGVEWSTDSKWQTFKRMLQAGGCEPTMTGAVIGCRVYTPKVSIATVNSRNLHGGLQYTATRSKRDRINTIIPRYRSETHDWEIVSGTPVSVSEYVTFDGRVRQKEYDLPLVQAEYGQTDVDGERQAGQLSAYEIVNAREAGPIRFTVGPEYVGLKAGDCVTLSVPEEGFNSTKILITMPPSFDPATGLITLVADTETDSKHAFALGKTTVSPPPFTLTPPDLKPTTPASGDWSVTAAGNSDGLPILLLAGGTTDGAYWDGITVQYKRTADSTWVENGTYPDTTSLKVEILVDGATSYDVRIAYKGSGGYSNWLSIGPTTSLSADLAVVWANVTGTGKPEDNATRNISAGVHSTSVAYSKGDFVRNAAGDATYIAKQNIPTGIAITNTTYWDLFVTGTGAPGENAISAFLTNASHVVATGTDGSGGYYASAGGTMRVFDGFVEKTTSGSVTYTKVGSGSWYSIDSAGVYTISDPGSDTATCQFDASYSGVTVRLTYSIAKSKMGVTGPTGPVGADGLPGAPGADGITYYTWFAYANSPDGTVDFTTGSPGNRAYIGIAANQTSATEGTNPAAYQWTAYKGPSGFGLNTRGGIVVAGNSIIKSGGNYAWDADAYSTEGFTNGAYCSFKSGFLVADSMAGLNQDPAASSDYTSIDYCWQLSWSTSVAIFESGSLIGEFGPYTTSTVLSIQYDGNTVKYLKDGSVVRTVNVSSGLTFYFDSSIHTIGGRITDIAFGPAGPAGPVGATGPTGPVGADGLPGAPGADGITYYTWFAYANSPDGTVDFTTGSPGNRAYIGIAANQTTATEGTNPAAYQWAAYKGPSGFGLNTRGGIVVAGNSVIKSGGTWGWNADAYSTEGFVNGAYCSFKFAETGAYVMAGLNQDPATDASYSSIDYCFYNDNGTIFIYESGNNKQTVGALNLSDVFIIQYDGNTVKYLRNGVVVRTVSVSAGLTFYFDSSIYSVGSRITDIAFGPAGSVGETGAPGADGLSIAATVPVMPVACNYTGVPKTGQLPRSTQFIVYSGNTNVTSSTSYTYSESNCNVTNNGGGNFTVTSMSADSAYFDVTATYNSKSITMRIAVTKVRDGSSALSATGAATINNTGSYTGTQGGPFTLPVGPNGTVTLDAVVNYYVNSGSATLYGKWQYRITPGSGGWTDVSAEVTGDTVSVGEPGSLIVNNTLSGPSSATNWEFQFVNRKGGSATVLDNGNSVATVTWNP